MYVSWPTQMVKVATPLSKAMEYETTPTDGGTINTRKIYL